MGAYLRKPVTDKVSSCGEHVVAGRKLQYASTAMQGWRVSMEDAHSIIPDMDKDTILFAVYDGHGGEEVAMYCATNLPNIVKSTETYSSGDLGQALKEAFMHCDRQLLTKKAVQEMKKMAKRDTTEGENSEEEGSQTSRLLEEAGMPLEVLLAQYAARRRRLMEKRDREEEDSETKHDSGGDISDPPPAISSNTTSASGTGPSEDTNQNVKSMLQLLASKAGFEIEFEDSSEDSEYEPNTEEEEEEEERGGGKDGMETEQKEGKDGMEAERGGGKDGMETEQKDGKETGESNMSRTPSSGTRSDRTSDIELTMTVDDEHPGKSANITAETTGSNRTEEKESSLRVIPPVSHSVHEDVLGETTEASATSSRPDDAKRDSIPVHHSVNSSYDSTRNETDESNKTTNTNLTSETRNPKDKSLKSETKHPNGEMEEKHRPEPQSRASSSVSNEPPRSKNLRELLTSSLDDHDRESRTPVLETPGALTASGENADRNPVAGEVPPLFHLSRKRRRPAEEDDWDETFEEQSPKRICRHIVEEEGYNSGTTAVVCLLKGQTLVVANAGDSRCVISCKGVAVDMSVDHKPTDLPELQRIERAGGQVGADSRVNGGLNLSRAIGDHFYKENASLPLEEQMITAMPDIQTRTLSQEDEFMVVACDGIWNAKSSQEVVDFVRTRLKRDSTPSNPQELIRICESLCDACLAPDTDNDGTGCDNMTCILVLLQPSCSQQSTDVS